MQYENYLAKLNEYILSGELEYKVDEPLSSHTSFRIGGPCDLALFPKSESALAASIEEARALGLRYAVLGNGSNLLCSDKGFSGVVIFTTKLRGIEIEGTTISAAAGEPFTSLAIAAQKAGLSGLEFAYGIPGSVGGAVYMNAGAYDGCCADVLLQSRYYDNGFGVMSKEAHEFDYRHSAYMGTSKTIVSATFGLKKGDPDEIKAKMDDFLARRKDKQPLEFPSAGSTFKRYPGYFTAKLIDEAGLKGFSIGDAQVSEKHAGFIINRADASSADVKALIAYIQKVIKERVGIDIEREVVYFGDD